MSLPRQAAADEGVTISRARPCERLGSSQRSTSCLPGRRSRRCRHRVAVSIKVIIEENLSSAYLTVAPLLNVNQTIVQRIFQVKNWQVKKHRLGIRPRTEALSPVARQLKRWNRHRSRCRPRHRRLDRLYKCRRPHPVPGLTTPAETFAVAA